MDIRNWGQTFMARIKQLPSQANGFANNLPNALNDLPKTVEDGAKAVLANEQVAEGWKTVGQGVSQLTGWKSSDQVNLSDAAKGGAKPEVPTATPDVPNPEPATDPVGKAVQDAASGTPKVTPAPQPVTPAPVTPAPAAPLPATDPVGKAVQGAADTPAATVTKTVRRARAAKEAGRVADGAKTTKAAKAASDAGKAASDAKAATNAGKAVVDAKPVVAEGPLSLSRLEAKPSFNNSALDLTDRASLLRQMGHKEEAKTLSTFADKLQRAGTFYDKNNKLISSRMLHAQEPLGLNNSELQTALKTSSKANELGAAFDIQPASQPFSNAARRMYARAEQLKQLGHPAEAAKLSNFADRLSQASEQAAKGQKAAAFKLFRRSFTPDTQAALKVSNQADEVYTAFSQEPQAAAKATKAASAASKATKAAATAGEAGKASKAAEAGRTAASASRVARGAKAAKAAAQAGGDATTVEVAGKAAKSAKAAQAAAHAGEARGIINAGKAAKGAKAAANAAADAGAAANAAGDAGKAVAHAAADAGNAAKDVAVAGDAGKAVEAGSGAAKGIMGGIKGFFGKIGSGFKGFFGKFTKGAGSSAGWATIKDGFAKMLPGLGKALKSSAIFSAVFSIGTNLFDVLRGKKTVGLAVGTVFGDTLGGAIGGVFSALASGAAIAGLGALGVVGLPLTLAAGAVGILGYMGFDHFFRNSSIYDSITHLFT